MLSLTKPAQQAVTHLNPMPLPVELYLAKTVSELDKLAIKQGTSGYELMQKAGHAVFSTITQHYSECNELVIFCGPGNNGGDGFVIATEAHRYGFAVTVILLADEANLKGDAKTAYHVMQQSGIKVLPFTGQPIRQDALIIDAILGTGVKGPLNKLFSDAIDIINQSPAPVIAVDVPTGLTPDTGHMECNPVKANLTVSFIGLKQGLLTANGPDYTGQLLFFDLGIDSALYQQVATSAERLNWENLTPLLPKRLKNSHKIDNGHVLVIGGNQGTCGAILLTGLAALRAGAGLVTIATHPEHAQFINVNQPELMCHGIHSENELVALIEKANAIAIGPGLGQNDWSNMLFDCAQQSNLPKVIDADALNLLAKTHSSCTNSILTPHPGEAARLLNTDSNSIQKDRFSACLQLSVKYHAHTILKGCGTILATDNKLALCDLGNPGMATAGMGDVLTGIITGLLAQGVSLINAAKLGVMIHASAGDIAAQQQPKGMIASDILPFVRQLTNGILNEEDISRT